MSLKKEFFGKTKEGKTVSALTLKNKNGMELTLLDFGATIKNIIVPDKNGKMRDVVIGHMDLSEYEKSTYQGATIGRYANCIAKANFTLANNRYVLTANNGEHTLHGGQCGYNLVLWEIAETNSSDEPSVAFRHYDPDMHEGYPGNVEVLVTFKLTMDNSLFINYKAKTDKDTVISLTNHSYFNLNGYSSGNIMNHFVKINANNYTPIDKDLVPTGEMKSVIGTPFDFRNYKTIEQDINIMNKDLIFAEGYDHNFVLNQRDLSVEAMSAYSDESKILLTVFTDMPGVQFYTANSLDGTDIGKDGNPIEYRAGFCFETQFFPDSPNNPQFPSCILKKGEEYNHTTIFRFSLKQ